MIYTLSFCFFLHVNFCLSIGYYTCYLFWDLNFHVDNSVFFILECQIWNYKDFNELSHELYRMQKIKFWFCTIWFLLYLFVYLQLPYILGYNFLMYLAAYIFSSSFYKESQDFGFDFVFRSFIHSSVFVIVKKVFL